MTSASIHQDRAGGARWTACLLLILALHAAVLLVIARRPVDPAPAVGQAEPILLDMAPEPAAPTSTPVLPTPAAAPALAAPVEPEQAVAREPEPTQAPPPVDTAEPPPEVEPLPAPVPALPMPAPLLATPIPMPVPPPIPVPEPPRPPRPPPRPVRHAQPHQTASAPPPSPAEPQPASTVALPHSPAPQAAASPTPNPQAAASWRSFLLGRLQAAKRYPERARARGDQGVALMTFTLDRAGRVLSASLARSSGSVLLDEEAVALIHRAEPLPPPPSDLQGPTLTLTVPVSFALR